MTKTALETALEAEITDHLGYDKHDLMGCGGYSRNGTRPKREARSSDARVDAAAGN